MHKGLVGISSFSLLLLAAGMISMIQIPEEADGVGELIGSIDLLPDTKYTDIHSGTSALVTFYGEISVEWPVDIQAQYAVIDLTIHSEPFKSTEVPPLIVMPGMTKANFTFSVILPYELPYPAENGTGVYQMTVDGTWRYEPNGVLTGSFDPKDFKVMANQFYQYTVWSDQPYIQTSPGGAMDLKIKVRNDGNGDDMIHLEINNKDELEKNGWTMQLFRSEFDLPYAQTITITIPVTTPVDWSAWKNEVTQIHFTVSSEQAQAGVMTEEVDYFIFIRQTGIAVPGFEIPVILISILFVSILTSLRRR
jgi:hypothetical protein